MSVFNRSEYTSAHRAVSTRMLKVEEEEEKTYTDDVAPMERLVVRDLPYNQSSNTLRIRHQMSKKHSKESGLRSAGSISFFHWYVEVS